MRNRSRLALMLMLVVFVCAGCPMFQTQPNDSPQQIEQTATQIRIITKTAMGAYLNKVFEKKPEKAMELTTKVLEQFDDFIDPVLNKDNVSMTEAAIDAIVGKLTKVDKNWELYLSDGWELLKTSVVFPKDDAIMDSKGVRFLKAFLQGVKEACVRFKKENEDNG